MVDLQLDKIKFQFNENIKINERVLIKIYTKKIAWWFCNKENKKVEIKIFQSNSKKWNNKKQTNFKAWTNKKKEKTKYE